MDQRLQYFVTATHYLTGICPLLLLLVPPLQIFFNLTPMNLDLTIGTWLLYYAGFYVMQIVVAFYTLGSFRFEVLMLAAVSFPIYVRALVNAVFKREQKWHVTGSKGAVSSPFNFMMPQVWFFAFLLITTAVAVWKDLGNGYFSLALAWNATNTVILGAFVLTAVGEARRNKRAAATAKKQPEPAPVQLEAPREAVLVGSTTGGAA
jgi:cellulose synthase (UDP-forming)